MAQTECKNKRRMQKAKKSEKYHRQKKQEKKKSLPPQTLEIADMHLFSTEKLRNKLRNPMNKIDISGKKKRRITKRLGHTLREKGMQEDPLPGTTKIETLIRDQQTILDF